MAQTRCIFLGLVLLLSPGCVNKQQLLRADKLSEQVEALDKQGQYSEALPLAKEALGIREGELGDEHARVAQSLNRLAGVHYSLAEYDQAQPLYERAMAIREKLADRAGVAETLNDLAALLYQKGEFDKARAMYKLALKIREEVLGAEHKDVAQTMGNLGALLLATGDFNRAQLLFERALSIQEKAQGKEHRDVAVALNNLAMLHRYKGEYAQAKPLLERALGVHQKALGEKHPEVAQTLNNLAMVLQSLGDFHGARPLLDRALTIRRAAYGEEHPEVALSINNLAMWFWRMGEYATARPLYERSLEITEKVLGPEHPDVATSMNNLATLLDDMGDFARARELLEKSLALMEKTLGPKHPNLAANLNNLALLLQSMGDYGRAKEMLQRSISIKLETVGKNHPDTLTSIMNLGLLMQFFGDYDEAKRILEENLQARMAAQGKKHPDVASSQVALARVLLRMREQDRAAKLYDEALAIWEKVLGPEHPHVADVLNDMGLIQFNLGNAKKARAMVDRAYAIKQKVFGKEHPAVMLNMINVVYMHWAAGEIGQARKKLIAGFAAIEKNITPLLDATSERERIALILSQRGYLNTYLSLFVKPEDGARAYRAVLRWKAVVSNTLVAQRAAVLASREPALRGKFEQLHRLRRTLAQLVFMPPQKGQEERLRAYLDQLYQQKDALERELAEKSKDFSRDKSLKAAGLEQVCAQLEPGQALVDYLAYELLVPDDKTDLEKSRRRWKYVAYVIRGGECRPTRVDVGDADPINRTIKHFRRLMEQSTSARRINRQGKRLRRLVWDPVVDALGGAKYIWVVPDGALNGVPFGALLGEKAGYLIEQYTFSYLTSGLDLLRLVTSAKSQGNLVAGGIDYGKAEGGKAAGPATHRAPKNESGLFPVSPLPATKKEADAVAGMLGKGTVLLTGAAASEARVKRESPGKRVLHLATHGFFATGKVQSSLAGTRAMGGGGDARTGGFNPMLLSGVVLAGANQREIPKGAQDGILTAEEVGSLDLRGCELVTLSACETGLGELVTGEGVMGLRRAFATAGARALVLSLWKVPDQDTRRLMEAFYRQASQPAVDKARALRQAKLKLIEYQRREYEHSDPRSWGAFIVSGR